MRLLLRPLPLPAICLALAGPTALAAQPFAHNKLEHTNWWLTDREDLFPNYLSAGGNVAGDGLFKVVPAEVMERGADHRVSGYQMAFSIDDAYTGGFPASIQVPGVQLYRTKHELIGGTTYEVLDRSQPIGPAFPPINLFLPSDNAWVVEVRFDPANTNPNLRALLRVPPVNGPGRRGVAMLVRATPGDRRAPAVPGVVLQASFAERHLAPGRPSYSGSYNAADGSIGMYGTSGMPSATGELYAALRFEDATLQLAGSSAGGLVPDPQGFETQLGPGAYATDLASRLAPGRLRLFVQAMQHDPRGGLPTHLAFPFVVAVGALGPTVTIDAAGVPMRVDPAALALASVFVEAGLFGPLVRLPAATTGGFDLDQLGVWNSSPLGITPSRALVGADLWIQALVTTVALAPVQATNAVRLSLR